jgi:hypothetical protein
MQSINRLRNPYNMRINFLQPDLDENFIHHTQLR